MLNKDVVIITRMKNEGMHLLKEHLKQKAWELAYHYSGERIRIEINIDKLKNDCKISVTDHE